MSVSHTHPAALFFQVGLPAKSGVSGAILLVVPNVMGVMCWSPPLDKVGNSVRGIQFCEVRVHLLFVFFFEKYLLIFLHTHLPISFFKMNTCSFHLCVVLLLGLILHCVLCVPLYRSSCRSSISTITTT